MGFKEGYQEGMKKAEKIYDISSEFKSKDDIRIPARLRQTGISPDDLIKLGRWPKNKEELGWVAAAIVFGLTHGTIWNSEDQHN